MSSALARRCVHTGLAGGVFLLPLVPWWIAAAAFVAAALFNAAVLAPKGWLARQHDCGRNGLVLYPLSLALLLLLFQEGVVPVQCAWFAMAVGDGLAPLFRHGGPRWPWREDKEIGASILAYGLAVLLMLSVADWRVALAAGSAGMLAETTPRALDDNLTVPLAAAAAAHFAGGTPWAG